MPQCLHVDYCGVQYCQNQYLLIPSSSLVDYSTPPPPQNPRPRSSQPHKPERSLLELISFSLNNFPYGIVLGVSVTLLSLEAESLAPKQPGPLLAGFCVIAGIVQLICPIIGKISDRWESKWGRRLPWMTFFAFPAALGFLGLYHFSRTRNAAAYVGTFFFAMAALSCGQTASLGLTPDLVPKSQLGQASGISGALWFLGALAGNFCLQGVAYVDFRLLYPVIVGAILVFWFLSIALVREESSLGGDSVGREGVDTRAGGDFSKKSPVTFGLIWRWFVDCFHVDRTLGRDFLWVTLGRTLYYCSVGSQAYIFFYLRDFLTPDREVVSFHLAGVAMFSYSIGVLGSLTLGRLSDSGAIGRKRMVYLSCCMMSIVGRLVIEQNDRADHVVNDVVFHNRMLIPRILCLIIGVGLGSN